MTLTDLLEEFNVVIDTHEGLSELRSLILGLAVRGKLSSNEISELVSNELGVEQLDIEPPFVIPENWKWTKNESVIDFQGGSQPPKSNFIDSPEEGFVQLIQIRDLGPKPQPVYVPKELVTKFCTEDDILIGRYGASVGKVFWGKNGAYNVALVKILFDPKVLTSGYLYYFFQSDFFQSEITGISRSAQAGFNKGDIKPLPFPLPPLEEQHRIVAKIESLFAEVDELEAQLEAQNKLDEKLQLAVNAEVQQAPDAEASKTAWNIITSNFETLYHTPESIDNLKKNILNEAVRGRLVPQDSNDEPASELLKKIEDEKQRLYEAGEIRKPKALPPVTKDEIPFEIPDSWEWCRVGFFTSKLGAGKTPTGGREVYQETGIPFLRSQNVWNDGLELEAVAKIPDSIHESMINTEVKPNDLLINITGASIGRCAIVPSDFDKGNVSQHVCIIRLVDRNLNKYFHFLLTSPFAWSQVMSKQVGISREGLSKNKVRDFLISLPPLAEQHRIVQRIEELFAICDAYKAQLEQREQVNERLVKGLVQEVLEGV